jgi:zinc-ribbon domain
MASAPRLVTCSSCGQHAKRSEIDCPHCGARLRGVDGSIPVTAVAILMGLSAAVACTQQTITKYGCFGGCGEGASPGAGGDGGGAVDGGNGDAGADGKG